MIKKILIYGAGAIGRGFIPWIIDNKKAEVSYVDNDVELINNLKKNNFFYTFKIEKKKYIKKKFFFNRIYKFNEEINDLHLYDIVILCAGPRNLDSISKNLKNYKKNILLLENDKKTVKILKNNLNKKNIFFGIPDVISSNGASKDIRNKYGITSLITEDGICYIDKSLKVFFNHAVFLDESELKKQWICKLYLHNTVHCILAYLGHIKNVKYIHDIANQKFAKKIINGCFKELSILLNRKYKLNNKVINFYSLKERRRFSNNLLFDPIERVAREPFRKLKVDDRLIGAANECISNQIYPENILFGVFCAFFYKNRKDPDFNISYLMSALKKEDFLQIAIGLRKNEPIYDLLLINWKQFIKKIKEIKKIK